MILKDRKSRRGRGGIVRASATGDPGSQSKGRLPEIIVNSKLAELLGSMNPNWSVEAERTQRTRSHHRPDIILSEAGAGTVIIETEYVPARTVDRDAVSRFDVRLRGISGLAAVVSLKIPYELGDCATKDLATVLQETTDFQYAVFFSKSHRFPNEGYLEGGIFDIADLVRLATVPSAEVEVCVDSMTDGVERISDIIAGQPEFARKEIAKLLRQDPSPQTWRMAGLVLQNAMLFYENISGSEESLVPSHKLQALHRIEKSRLLGAWDSVLRLNYDPIFSVARDILSPLSSATVGDITSIMLGVNGIVAGKNMIRAGDLYGYLLQRTISDRKKLAVFYTPPESAALLSTLAMPGRGSGVWADPEALRSFCVADFTCGTGMLLASAYRRIISHHDAAGNDTRDRHPDILKQVIVGYDVLPIAAHMTVSSLASLFPRTTFRETRIMHLRLGEHLGSYYLGSLSLIDPNHSITGDGIRLTGAGEERTSVTRIADGSCDVVIMNPPFVRNTNHGGGRADPYPAFSAFGIPVKIQKELASTNLGLFKGTCAHGNAGIASNFVAIADAKLKPGGTMGFILPATVTTGDSWRAVRSLVSRGYDNVTLVGIKSSNDQESSFSADTGMSEIMLVAQKRRSAAHKDPRMRIVVLDRAPKTPIEGVEFGKRILGCVSARGLEDGLDGGTPLLLGTYRIGSAMTCPLSPDWYYGAINDLSILQCAYQLERGRLMLAPGVGYELHMSTIGDIADIGPHALDIIGDNMRGPFTRHKLQDGSDPRYIALWGNDAEAQISMEVPSDKQLSAKAGSSPEHLEDVYSSATHAHMNINPRYTSQRLCAAYTDRKSLGGRSWPSVVLNNKIHEKSFVVWFASTLGILSYWVAAGKQQQGRGMTSRTAIKRLPVLDFARYDKHGSTRGIFDPIYDEFRRDALLPINRLYEDPVRREIDSAVMATLGIDEGLDDLRRRLCAEPHMGVAAKGAKGSQ